MIYNVVLVSANKVNQLSINIHPLFLESFPTSAIIDY